MFAFRHFFCLYLLSLRSYLWKVNSTLREVLAAFWFWLLFIISEPRLLLICFFCFDLYLLFKNVENLAGSPSQARATWMPCWEGSYWLCLPNLVMRVLSMKLPGVLKHSVLTGIHHFYLLIPERCCNSWNWFILVCMCSTHTRTIDSLHSENTSHCPSSTLLSFTSSFLIARWLFCLFSHSSWYILWNYRSLACVLGSTRQYMDYFLNLINWWYCQQSMFTIKAL